MSLDLTAPPRPVGWVRLAIGIGLVCYTVFAVLGFVAGRTPGPVQELVVAAIIAVAFSMARRRPFPASAITIAVVWLEQTGALAQSGDLFSTAPLAYPLIVAATGMLFGGRAALPMATISMAAMPTMLFFHRWTHGEPPLNGRQLFFLLAAELIVAGMGLITRASVMAFDALFTSTELARRRYTALFWEAPDGMMELDSTGRIVEANPTAARLLGGTTEQLVGSCLLDAIVAAKGPKDVDLASARPGAPLEVELGEPGAGRRTIEITTRSVPTQGGAASLVALRDVTERGLMRDRLAHSQRMETVGQLAGGIAHDFNNLLTAVGGNASLLLEKADPEVNQLAAEIMNAQSRGIALTRQLLAFARRDERQPVVLDLAEVARGASRLLTRILDERYVLSIECDAPAPVEADRGQLEQVLLNLVANARDALPDGGTVTVSIAPLSREQATARGSELTVERQVELQVADQGVGMSKEVLAHIFEPFFTTKPRGKGSGLGLATVHGIVAQTGGHIAVDTSPGRGARLRIFFPARVGQVVATGPAVRPATVPAAAGERILLVEDDPLVMRVANRVLRGAGYDVVETRNGAEALGAFAARNDYDLLLTDVAMPGLSGPQLAARLREVRPDLRVLFMSGYIEVPAREDGLLGGGATLLTKPFRPDELLRSVREVLRRTSPG